MAIDERDARQAPEKEPTSTGLGLLKGLGVTLKHALRPSITQQYPQEKPDLPPRTRGVIALKESNCTVCYKCSRECPDWCIYIDAHKETHEPASGGKGALREGAGPVRDRLRAVHVLRHLRRGVSVRRAVLEPGVRVLQYGIDELTHEKEKLEEWTYDRAAAAVPRGWGRRGGRSTAPWAGCRRPPPPSRRTASARLTVALRPRPGRRSVAAAPAAVRSSPRRRPPAPPPPLLPRRRRRGVAARLRGGRAADVTRIRRRSTASWRSRWSREPTGGWRRDGEAGGDHRGATQGRGRVP